MIAGFGWSAGDIAIAIKVLVKVGKAFHSTTGAATRYNEAIQFLQSLKITLNHIADYTKTNEDDFYVDDIVTQLEHIRPAWVAFETFLAPFSTSLSPASSRTSFRRAPRTIEYALRDLGGEIEKLKAAVTQPLQVVNVLLSLQATQRAAIRRENGRPGSNQSQTQDNDHVTPMSLALQGQLDKLQASQDAQLERLATAVEGLAIRAKSENIYAQAHGNESRDTLASLGDSALGTDMSSIFSSTEASLYSGTDASSIFEHDDCKAATTAPETCRTVSRLAVYGYRQLSPKDCEGFFVPGRVFIILQRLMQDGDKDASPMPMEGRESRASTVRGGIQRFLVIHTKASKSICVPIHRLTHQTTSLEDFGPYEVPLCTSSSQETGKGFVAANTLDSLSLEMVCNTTTSDMRLPPHCFVKLRDTCMISHDEKVMNVGLVAGDDRALLLGLWEDANAEKLAE